MRSEDILKRSDMAFISSEHTLRYKNEAACFNEALPLGNGRIGAMVYGGAWEEKISLNEDTLWSGYPKKANRENYPLVYRKAKQLFEEGKIAEAQRLLENSFGDYLVQMYLPLADLKIRMQYGEEYGEVKRYSRVLRLDSAIHTVTYVVNDKRYTRECFVSEPFQVLAVRFLCDRESSISFEVFPEGRLLCGKEYSSEECCASDRKSDENGMICICGTAPNSVAEYGSAYRSLDAQIYDGKGIRYAYAVSVKARGGTVSCRGDKIRVDKADEAVLYFGVRTNFRGFDLFPSGDEYKSVCIREVKSASELDYEVLKKASIRSHKKLYNRCQISFGAKTRKRISTDARLKQLWGGAQDNGLYALLFNFGKYLTIAGSRTGTQAMNLQGIWNDRLLPPWNSNYTLNINTEMNYWPTLGMGLFECYEPFIRMVEELAESGRKTAELYYGAEGWVCHHSSDIWRLTHPGTNRLPGNAQWGFWNMASGWLSVMLWDYYRYTLDISYLKRIFPIIEGAARFYRGLLVECNGELILPLSTSPENNYIRRNNIKRNDLSSKDKESNTESALVCAIDCSTAMTQEILSDLFGAVSEASKVLGLSGKQGCDYDRIRAKLKRPVIQSNGELCEWSKEHEVWEAYHRHVSHLYGMFPSDQFAGNTEWMEACRKVLESRGDGGTGWSLAWKINLWARLGDGEHALRLLNDQLRPVPSQEDGHDVGGGSYPNLFCAHPPFQIDGNFGAASGIMQMLIQCDEKGDPMLLPALPKSWRKGSVKNVCLPGNRRISFAWEDGKVK